MNILIVKEKLKEEVEKGFPLGKILNVVGNIPAEKTPVRNVLFSADNEDILKGETADIYFRRTKKIVKTCLAEEKRRVLMEIFSKGSGVLCGIDEAVSLLANISKNINVYVKKEGSVFKPNEVVMRILGDYTEFCEYETAILGILASSSGWATASFECKAAASNIPITCFGARHIHPAVVPVMERAALIGGCSSIATPAGAKVSHTIPVGTTPHALMLLVGNTVTAASWFDQLIDKAVKRVILVDTFKDEVEEALNVAKLLGDKLYGVRLDTPKERGGVTPELVIELREKLNLNNFPHVKIFVSGGITPTRINLFKGKNAPVDSFGIGSYISGATPIDFTGDIKVVAGKRVAKRGRIPGISKDNLSRVL